MDDMDLPPMDDEEGSDYTDNGDNDDDHAQS